jgi:phosphoribosylformimino-5-aminoimidazole carboxamide ribotide isomerase
MARGLRPARMRGMRVIPAIDLRGGRCVRLVQGDYGREVQYDLDPVEVAVGYAKAGATLIHVVDLDAAKDGWRKNGDLVQRIVKAAGVQVEVGGGLRSVEAVADALEAGAAFAVVGTLAAEQPELLPELGRRFGRAVVLGLDVKDGAVAVRGWESKAPISPLDLARQAKAAGLERAIYTEVSRDGTFLGPDVDGARRLQLETGLRVTLSGGVGDADHVKAAAIAGLDACIVGRALLEGRLTVAGAIAASKDGVVARQASTERRPRSSLLALGGLDDDGDES